MAGEGCPSLDQVSSQTLTPLAATRGAVTVTPAGEDVVRVPSVGWKRWLPYLFFGLSLFSLYGMTLGLTGLADDGWTFGDAVQVALMALLVLGVFAQSRLMLRSTKPGRWLLGLGRSPSPPAGPRPVSPRFALDAVSGDELAHARPARLPGSKRAAVVRRAGSRWFERTAVVTVVVLAVLAASGMVFLCGYVAFVAGPEEPSLWLTLPFTALTCYGTFRVYRAARQSAFRGRPGALLQRAFRDSVRVWGSGSMVTNLLLTGAATASISTAAIAPLVANASSPLDLFVVDQPTGAVYRIDLATNTSYRLALQSDQVRPLGVGTANASFQANGRKVPRGSLVFVLEGARSQEQSLVAFAPGSAKPVQVARLQSALGGASFTGGQGRAFALQPDGALWSIEIGSGAVTKLAELDVDSGLLAYDAEAKSLLVLGAGEVLRLDSASGAVLSKREVGLPADVRACGFAAGKKGVLWVSDAASGTVLALDPSSGEARKLAPVGDVAAHPCALTLAFRR